MTNYTISNTDDTIDVRDIIARVEELEEIEGIQETIDSLVENDDAKELVGLRELLGELKGNGGDEQWKGDWYPISLIRDSYFNDAMDELLEDIGDLPKDLPCYLQIKVDYKALQMDYSSVEFDGVTYWYR